MPRNKTAVLGLVSTKTEDIEPMDGLKRRIDDAAKILPLEQLALSPQCGFGGVGAIQLSEVIQWGKFRRILETAVAVWGDA